MDFEKIDPASWATFSPESQKIVANARRPLRGRNGILKITLRWVSTTVKIHAKGIRPKTTVWATNRVPVARFGLKLGQNESYGLQGPF